MAKTIIDVSEHQSKINWSAVKPHIDGAIIRCGYGDDDKSQDDEWWTYNVQQCEKLGIPYGVYLYSYADSEAHIKSEIAHTKRLLKGHNPQYPVYIDLEESRYGSIAKKAANEFCKAITAAGYTAGVYTYESFYNSFMSGWKAYTLWIARYNDNSGKPGTKPNIGVTYDAWQYTSNGKIQGYASRLDVSLFYKDFAAKSSTPASAAKPAASTSTNASPATSKIDKMVDIAKKYAADDRHGYSQKRRWPKQGTDFDCSSLMYECAHEAGYNVPVNMGYTGSMLADFKKAGFTAIPFKQVGLKGLRKGDILLNVRDHTEMYIGNGKFVGAHIAETGGVDGKPGDQTGNEISICNAYVFSNGWDYVLRPPASSPEPAPQPTKISQPQYRVYREGKWRSWKQEGKTAGVADAVVYDMDFKYLGKCGWFQLTLKGGKVLAKNKHNDEHKLPVIGVTVYYDTDTTQTGGTYYEALYRVYANGQWLKWEHDDNDGGAGDDKHAIRRFQMKLAACK